MAAQNGFPSIVGKVSVFLGKACGVFYIAAIGLSVFEVFMRYALNAPTAWTTETIMALCGTAWLLSVGAVTQQHRHITVTVMEMVVGEKVWRRMANIAILLSLLGVCGLLWSASGPALNAISHIERSGSAFNPPVPSFLKVMLAIACILYAIQLVAGLLARSNTHHDHGTSHADLSVDVKE